MEHALTLERVTKSFGDYTAVDGVSLTVPRGSIYGFLGPNGAGKTTTIRMIMSILYPDAGSIEVLGHQNPEAVKDRLGYLPEEKGLYKKMRTGEIVSYFGRLKGLGAGEAQKRAKNLLTRFGLGDWIDKKCETLSKGMSQKVQILGTLIHEPELVILDEPFSGLDPVNVETVIELILHMKREGRTVIFSTHVMEQAEKLCDFILLINQGKKVLDGALSAVKSGGPRTILIDYDGDGAILKSLPRVSRVNDSGKHAELTLEDGADAQAMLRALVDRLTIRRFDTREPSLHEIFVRAVGGTARA
ncbi:MAG TPA: ATP-binding cassette domain-containing protein [Gemmatimonadales bacterium]|nr:ATP-binding cassette domain-containing protein [Gemmatimonadales bacterium]